MLTLGVDRQAGANVLHSPALTNSPLVPAGTSTRVAVFAALLAVLVGAGGLLGWIYDVPLLSRLLNGGVQMRPITGICLMLCGAGLLLATRRVRWTNTAAAVSVGLVLVVAVLTIIGRTPGAGAVGQFIVRALDAAGAGRMSIMAAVNFIAVGLGIHTLRARSHWSSQLLAAFAGITSLIALVGYVYDVTTLYSLGRYGTVAVNSAMGFGVLAIGILCAREDDGLVALLLGGTIGGALSRRIVPAAMLVPLVLGWVRLEGERGGFYGTAFGVAIFAMTNVVFFVILTTATAAFLDKTDRQRQEAERALADLNAELEARVQARTNALEAANRELEAFSYSVSHDLRAPLRTVAGFSQILLDEHSQTLSDQAAGYLRRVAAGATQMGQLVDDLLSLSRLGRAPMKRTSVDPAEVAREALEDLRTETDGRELTISIGTLPACAADRGLLKQVYANLLGNAVKFTRHTPHAVIEVGCRREDGDDPVYFVRDNGVGFDMRYADKLFGVFQRLHRVDEYEGTGVGLAIVSRIVARHGGTVSVDAAPNQGACFSFTIGGQS